MAKIYKYKEINTKKVPISEIIIETLLLILKNLSNLELLAKVSSWSDP